MDGNDGVTGNIGPGCCISSAFVMRESVNSRHAKERREKHTRNGKLFFGSAATFRDDENERVGERISVCGECSYASC